VRACVRACGLRASAHCRTDGGGSCYFFIINDPLPEPQLQSFIKFFESKCPNAMLCQAVKECNFGLVRKLVQDGYDLSEKDQVTPPPPPISLQRACTHAPPHAHTHTQHTHTHDTYDITIALYFLFIYLYRTGKRRCTGLQRR
jgi:hypothetical protein